MNQKTKAEKLNRLLPEIEKKICDSFGEKVQKIILFGSYARGDFDEESDVDILVIVDDENLNYYKKKSTEIISFYLNEEELFLSIIIESASFIERYKNYSPFLINVNNEGRILYG